MSTREVSTKGTPLNARQQAFVLEYLKDRNATQAAIRAGYSTASAKQIGSKLLTQHDVRQSIEQHDAEVMDRSLKRVGLTIENLLREVARGALFDVRKLLDADGNPLPLHLLDDDTASAIAGLDLVTEHDKDGKPSTAVRRYKLADRKGFIDMGLKVLGGYKKDNDQAAQASANALGNLLGSMRRSALPIVQRVDDDELV